MVSQYKLHDLLHADIHRILSDLMRDPKRHSFTHEVEEGNLEDLARIKRSINQLNNTRNEALHVRLVIRFEEPIRVLRFGEFHWKLVVQFNWGDDE